MMPFAMNGTLFTVVLNRTGRATLWGALQLEDDSPRFGRRRRPVTATWDSKDKPGGGKVGRWRAQKSHGGCRLPLDVGDAW